MKKTKLIIPALGMLLLSTAASITGTVAWFSANNSVNVDGMTATTQVKGNLAIASSNSADSNYGTGTYTQTFSPATALLEPVSTADGVNFFWTISNVSGTGATTATELNAYDPADLTAFEADYSAGAVGYVDYQFYLKATSDVDSQDVVISKINLLYNGTSLSANDRAWRTAVFAQKVNETVAGSTPVVGDLKTIVGPASAAYFNSEAAIAASGTIFGTAPALTAGAKIDTIATKGTTQRYYVVVRLYLEGNDTSCNNDTYATLTDEYGLYLKCELGGTASTQIVSQIAAQVTNTTTTASVAAQNGETIVSRQWQRYSGNPSTWSDISGETAASYNGNDSEVVRCKVVTETGTYVTNSVTLTAE